MTDQLLQTIQERPFSIRNQIRLTTDKEYQEMLIDFANETLNG